MGSKLGLHGIFSNNIKKFTQQVVNGGAHYRAVKAVDDISWLKEIKQVSPKTLTFGRFTRFHDTVQMTGDIGEEAVWVMDKVLPDMERHRDYVDYWEITNEMDPPSVDGYRKFAELHFHLMDIAEREGFKIALFSWNAGTPEWDELEAVVETGVFGRAKQGGHTLSLHEGTFGMQNVRTWFGNYDTDGNPDPAKDGCSLPLPGDKHTPSYMDRGALCCRYRWLYEDFLKPRDEVIPVLISEFGMGQYRNRNQTPQAWTAELAWFDERMREDYYVIGNCMFTLGWTGQWESHDFEAAMPAINEHVIAMKDSPEAEWPEDGDDQIGPPPVVISGRGAPREQYERVYVLLPPGASSAWAQAVLQATWDDRRYTVGSSADDAGIGNLDKRIVLAINPSGWPTDLASFFEQFYPGITYQAVQASSPAALHARLSTMPARQATPSAPSAGRGAPREQYKRAYVLLPPGAGSKWAQAVVEATWDKERYTVGSSADDAGIGDLDQRVIVAVNPSGWPTDLGSFFEQHYAGVQYSEVEAETAAQLGARFTT